MTNHLIYTTFLNIVCTQLDRYHIDLLYIINNVVTPRFLDNCRYIQHLVYKRKKFL